jgi:hypothetical protein
VNEGKRGTGAPTDVRGTRRREQRRLVWIVAAFLVVVGTLVIALVYGTGPAILGLVCLLAGAAVLLLIWAALLVVERLAR